MTLASKMTKRSAFRRWLLAVFNWVQGSPLTPISIRLLGLRLAGMRIGDACHIFEHVYFGGNPRRVVFGNNVFINVGCKIDAAGMVIVEDNVYAAMDVNILTSTHEVGLSSCRAGVGYTDPVIIKRGCWLCSNALILPGVVVERGCIIAAGAVVRENTKPDGLYAGVPAQRVKELPCEWEPH